MRATRALIHTDNIVHNIKEIKKHLGGARFCAVVKANGYGSSAKIVAKTAQDLGITDFAVATVREGIELREAGIIGRILLLSPFDPLEATDILENYLTPCISNIEGALSLTNVGDLSSIDRVPEVFLAVDTGMGRVGCKSLDAGDLAHEISLLGVTVAGLITHFSVGDSAASDDVAYTKKQFSLFQTAIDRVVSAGFPRDGLCCTASASSAFLMGQDASIALDMVRVGVILYGLPPSKDLVTKMKEIGLKLSPVMSVVTKVMLVKNCEVGDFISYGRTFCCKKKTNIAILPIGYADGIQRRYGAFLKVMIGGKSYPVVGRVCMDMIMVDLGCDTVEVGADAIIFGDKDKGAAFDATDIADNCDTINYEVTSLISSRVPRVAV